MIDQRVYKNGVTKDQIVFDGWSRGFEVLQTVREVEAQGFEVTEDEVTSEFKRHQFDMEEYYQRDD